MLEKPEAAVADLPTETDQKKRVFPCWSCQKTDHGFFDCPTHQRLSQRYPKTDHNTSDCPNATEDVLKNLRYCQICGKNTDHGTFDCPNEDGFIVLPSGAKIPNFCNLCRKVGHMRDCPLDPDNDLEFDLSGDDDW
uniref:zinc finger CCHC domain-containing protein 9-like n=1 Tax=Fragaria vesca subsp. vesca TaxID=101020 RepID=UPI0005C9FB82|nr:PREDICTED: zinc finger CCHC domain-containing protein 9-like [Fragaria vesca subsp. vesca]